MDGVNGDKDRVCGDTIGTSVENTLIPIEYINIDEILEYHRKNEGDSANAEKTLPKFSERKWGMGLVLRRIISTMLAAVGMLSFVYIGFRCVKVVRDGGFVRIVSNSVFGGVVSEISPIIFPDKDVSKEEIQENLSNVENVPVSLENIGCSDPGAVFNETKYDPDGVSIPTSSAIPKFKKDSAVLIIHTHGTESYSDNGHSVSENEDFRTDSSEDNVIAVGKAFAEILEEKGIKAIHCTEMFDRESYINAYNRSAEAVKEYMKKYPEISYVLDIHRDAVIRSDGTVVRSDGNGAAQLMIVCGTDEMGADFPRWRENFAFGREYQQRLFENDPYMVRHMNLRSASFNQQLCERYLLLEVGTCGNTLDEAKKSATTAASVFADMLLENAEE